LAGIHLLGACLQVALMGMTFVGKALMKHYWKNNICQKAFVEMISFKWHFSE
jgi:hypothetical protein